MSSTLRKKIDLTFIPGSPGHDGHPGQEYQPARWVTTTEEVCAYVAEKKWVYYDGSGEEGFSFTTPGWYEVPTGEYIYVCETVTTTTYYPEVPYIPPTPPSDPVPSEIIKNFNLGWNSRARSRRSVFGAATASFKVPRSVMGVVAGLSTGEAATTGYADINFAFHLTHGVARIMESGAEVAYIGAYQEGDVFSIRRAEGQIHYAVNGVVVHTSPNSDEEIFLDAAVYSGGDTVLEPSLTDGGSGVAYFEPLAGLGGNVAYGQGHASFLPMQGINVRYSGGEAVFSPMVAIGSDRPYASGTAEFQPLTGQGDGGLVQPTYGLGTARFLGLFGYGYGFAGEVGSGTATMQPLEGYGADRPYGFGTAVFPAPIGYGSAYVGQDEAQVITSALMLGGLGTYTELWAVIGSSGNIELVVGVDLSAGVLYRATGEALSTYDTQQILLGIIHSTATGAVLQDDENFAGEVWVVSPRGSVRYDSYAFNSFAKLNGKYYGAKADGIYELEGDTDALEPIRAVVDLGKHDFRDSRLKRIGHCYLGVASGDRVFLKVIVDGQEYIYGARGVSDQLETQRVDIGKGLRARYYTFELYNSDGADIELESIEFTPAPLSRRI